MGVNLGCRTPAEAMAECAALTPLFAGISHARLDREGPYVLITGRRLVHHNTGSMTRRAPNAELLPRDVLDINPTDAAQQRLADGDRVEVASRRGAVVMPVRASDRVAPGEVFTTFHFPQTPVNTRTSDAEDTVTGCPEYKVTAVSPRAVGP